MDKKRYPKNNLRNPTQKELRDLFGDLPIVDASERLVIFPVEADFKNATPCDPHDCGFAHCAARTCGAEAAVVFKGTSYFDHLDSQGERKIHRYRNSRPTTRVIADFDRGEAVDLSKAFVFLPPGESTSLKYQKARSRQFRTSPRGKTLLAAWAARHRLQRIEADLEQWRTLLRTLLDTRPRSAAATLAKRQVARLRTRAKVVREEVGTTAAAADKVRRKPYRSNRTVAVDVRNGRGTLSWRGE